MRSHAFCAACVRRGGVIAKRDAWRAQDEEQFAGPEQNIEQPRAFKVGEILRLQADLQSFVGALFDEGAHSGKIHTLFAGFLAARINRF